MASNVFGDAMHHYLERYQGYEMQMRIVIEDLVKQEGLSAAILRQEKISQQHLVTLESFTQLPDVAHNIDEVRLLGVHVQDYLAQHYAIRGMATEVREQKTVDIAHAQATIAKLYAFQKGIDEAINIYFKHSYTEEVAKDSRSSAGTPQ